MSDALSEDACQLLNWARKIVLLSQSDYLLHYNNRLSATAKRQLRTFPGINEQPTTSTFPWNRIQSEQIQLQEHSPPLPNALPPDLPEPNTEVGEDNQESE
jgi:hypothetical protein